MAELHPYKRRPTYTHMHYKEKNVMIKREPKTYKKLQRCIVIVFPDNCRKVEACETS